MVLRLRHRFLATNLTVRYIKRNLTNSRFPYLVDRRTLDPGAAVVFLFVKESAAVIPQVGKGDGLHFRIKGKLDFLE